MGYLVREDVWRNKLVAEEKVSERQKKKNQQKKIALKTTTKKYSFIQNYIFVCAI